MSKAVLISIRPEWAWKILNGSKTVEIRKTRPKMNPPFKCYIYCTQSADMLWILKERERYLHPDKIADVFKAAKCGGAYRGNGKIIGEFVCDDIFERIVRVGAICEPPKYCICDWNMDCTPLDTLLADACLPDKRRAGEVSGRRRRLRLAYLQPKNLRYAEGTDRISHLEKMQIMQQKWVRKHSLYL